MREHGSDCGLIGADDAVAIEPALAHIRPRIAERASAPTTIRGCAHLHARTGGAGRAAGVEFRLRSTIAGIAAAGDAVEGVKLAGAATGTGILRADAYVVALGSYSPLLLRPLGVRLNIYPPRAIP